MEDPGSVWRKIPISDPSAPENSTQVIKLLDIEEFVILYLKKMARQNVLVPIFSVCKFMCEASWFKKNEKMRKYNIV